MTPKISIVIPAFNSEKFLTYTIESVLYQSFTDWELVLVDDGSTDSTPEIMRSFVRRDSRIRMVSQPGKGVSSARNAGLTITQETSYVIFLDADDTWEPEALATLYATMESDRDIAGAYGLARFVDQTGSRIQIGELEGSMRSRASYKNGRVVSIESDEPTTFYTMLVACCIRTPGVLMLRRASIQAVRSFDESLTHYEDVEFYLRILKNGSFKFIDRVLLSYRIHQNNQSSNTRKMRSGQHTVINKVSRSVEYSAEQRNAARHFYPAAQRYFAIQKMTYFRDSIREGNWGNSVRQLKYATGYFLRTIVAEANSYARKPV